MKVAVLGHIEWVDFVRVETLPQAGEIVRALDAWEEPAGGGGVAAGQLARLAGACTLYTALGNDERGARARAELPRHGIRVEAATRPEPQRRGVTFIDARGERSITVIGTRIAAAAGDPLAWDELTATDAVYVCAGDAAAIRLARRARVVVATARILPVLSEAGVVVDALVGSLNDPSERYADGDLVPAPKLVVLTDGAKGGMHFTSGAAPQRYAPAPLPGPVVDTYGAGDSFAAALAYGLAAFGSAAPAIALAARAGAAALTGRGAFAGRLDASALGATGEFR